MGKSTADRAAAKLFGGASKPKKPAEASAEAAPTKRAPKRKKGARGASSGTAPKRATAKRTGDRGNYKGGGVYTYRGEEAKKVSVYLPGALAAGLRMAAASGRDPRGSDMSEIVATLLRENGYEG